MTPLELINQLIEETRENIFAVSANYLMTVPKRGYELAFRQARQREEVLLEMRNIVIWFKDCDPPPFSKLPPEVYSGGVTP